MHNCIFNGHCIEGVCDNSCPSYVESSYLLERNNISIDSQVFQTDKRFLDRTLSTLKQADQTYKVVTASNTVKTAELITYCAICTNWKGSRLHCDVYNLKYSKYIEEIKKSWSKKESEDLEYMKIWADTSKVLIISNLDFMSLGDFECQTLLGLLQSRQISKLTTIIVCPDLSSLVGRGVFFDRLINIFSKAVIK